MKIVFGLVCLLWAGIVEAQSCLSVNTGWFIINHRYGLLRGGNFVASVSCTRNAPIYVLWRGGSMCEGGFFYGRNELGRSYRCYVRRLRLF